MTCTPSPRPPWSLWLISLMLRDAAAVIMRSPCDAFRGKPPRLGSTGLGGGATIAAAAAVRHKITRQTKNPEEQMAHRFGRLALHMWTIDTTPLATALTAAREAGYDAVELRRLDFKRCHDAGMSNAQVLDLVRKAGIAVGTVGVEPGWLFAKDEESKRIFGVFREQCANAVALGCGMLMSAPGPFTGTIAEAIANLRVAGDIAAEHGLRLALEFSWQHPLFKCLGDH